MELSLFLSMLSFLWVAAITPGPNNMLLTASGAHAGIFPSLFLMGGIVVGMQIMLLLVAFGIGGLILLYPTWHFILKMTGSLYLLWLAWKMATAPWQALETSGGARLSHPFWQGGMLQLVNPKAWLMALGAVSSFSLAGEHYRESIIAISLVMFTVNVVAGIIWLSFGRLIGRLLRSRQAWKAFNVTMALLTAACTVFIWLTP